MKKYLLFCLSSLMLTACSSNEPAYTYLDRPADNHGRLYVYRPHMMWGGKVNYEVYAGSDAIGTLRNGGRISKDFEPGVYQIHLKNTAVSINVPLRTDEIKCLRARFNKNKQPVLEKVPYEQCKVEITGTR